MIPGFINTVSTTLAARMLYASLSWWSVVSAADLARLQGALKPAAR